MRNKTLSKIHGVNLDDLKTKGFKVHELNESFGGPIVPARRDFFKVGLVTGEMTVYSGEKVSELKGTALFFVNPEVAHSITVHSKKITGYACVFTENFITGKEGAGVLQRSPLYQSADAPMIPLNVEQASFIAGVFRKMITVHSDVYPFKDELIKHCLELVIHEALRIQPGNNIKPFKNAATRITHLFRDLLERQFPVERTGDATLLRTAQDFARHLSVHVNYLNRAVKEITGKPTSVHIAERIAAEAKALLQHTDWSIADIAYTLGFDYPSYFNNYFKRVTGKIPKMFRKQIV